MNPNPDSAGDHNHETDLAAVEQLAEEREQLEPEDRAAPDPTDLATAIAEQTEDAAEVERLREAIVAALSVLDRLAIYGLSRLLQGGGLLGIAAKADAPAQLATLALGKVEAALKRGTSIRELLRAADAVAANNDGERLIKAQVERG